MDNPHQKGIDVLRQAIKTVGTYAGVYQMHNHAGEIIYVGKAKNLKNRLSSYTRVDQLVHRQKRMIYELDHLTFVITHSEIEALLLESNLIKKHQPRYNILLKDDKSFPYILITQDHPYPRINKYRGAKAGKGKYFGPFANVAAVDEAILSVQRVFQLRNCSDSYFKNRQRPCLQYYIKRCCAPCVDKISKEDYQNSVSLACQFLQGKTDAIQQVFAKKMEEASEQLNFEQAAIYRDRIKLLSQIQARQRINTMEIENADIIAICCENGLTAVQIFFFRHHRNYGNEIFFLEHTQGASLESQLASFLMQFYQHREPAPKVLLNLEPEDFGIIKESLSYLHNCKTSWILPQKGAKADIIAHAELNARQSIERKQTQDASMASLLDELVKAFDLPSSIERIEVYDNSHLHGDAAYGVMVVITAEGFERKSYRKFMIRDVPIGQRENDIAMMQEVMVRRFGHQQDWGVPSLLLIDGGLAQVNAVQSVLDSYDIDIPVIGISKGVERNAGRERFWRPQQKEPIHIEYSSSLMYFLQRIRDEAHRFAIGTQRAARKKNMTKSLLDQIPGVGPARKKLLLQHFGSARGVTMACLEDLQRVQGIDRITAEKIFNYLHENKN